MRRGACWQASEDAIRETDDDRGGDRRLDLSRADCTTRCQERAILLWERVPSGVMPLPQKLIHTFSPPHTDKVKGGHEGRVGLPWNGVLEEMRRLAGRRRYSRALPAGATVRSLLTLAGISSTRPMHDDGAAPARNRDVNPGRSAGSAPDSGGFAMSTYVDVLHLLHRHLIQT